MPERRRVSPQGYSELPLPILNKVNTAFQAIAASARGELGEVVERYKKVIDAGSLRTTGKSEVYSISTATDFAQTLETYFSDVRQQGPALGMGYIVVDISKVAQASAIQLQADYVRTMVVASQYPLAGYERRLQTVYKEAIQLQKDWLIQHGVPPIPFDPRTTDEERLLKEILGGVRYLSDVGFQDWKKVIDRFKVTKDHGIGDKDLDELRRFPELFVWLRAMRQKHVHRALTRVAGKQHISPENTEERAQNVAGTLLLDTKIFLPGR